MANKLATLFEGFWDEEEPITAEVAVVSNIELEQDPNSLTFTLYFIALAAKLAAIDGGVNELEFLELMKLMPKDDDYTEVVTELFTSACMDKRDETFYIKKIMQLLPEQYELFLELLYSLIRIAVVDEPINCKEIVWLRRMSFILGFNYIDFDKLFRHYFIDETIVDPYQILQVRRNININELHKIYRNLIHTCHPDKLVVYKDIAPEYQAIMQEKFCVLSGAYEQIKRMIGGKHNPR